MVEVGTEQRKRNVAYKLRIGDIMKGVPMMDEGKFIFLELGSRKVVRINILANCVDKFIQEGEKQFASLTIDDASGQLKLKAFGEDIEPLKNIMQGDTIQVIGNVREWNGEIYVIPEVVKKVDVRWLLVRKLEIQNARKDMPADEQATGNSSLKDSIMEKIKTAEAEGGIDADTIIMDTEASPDAINAEIKKLLEEGLIYEPRPGRLRYLG
ncbi:OB-fold nucleic acid binding domain-containing protein [Candidatus Pacearchaeota archaeon]|nr:OB-fold nucleic acid binding domain-containing protein [Candidatus Pacearchaeota archaeon]